MSWASKEFASITLPDVRLRRRLELCSEQLSRAPHSSIPRACGAWAATKGAYRLVSNPRVTSAAILSAHGEQTLSRCASEREVLCLGDTTDVNLSRGCPAVGVGGMSDPHMRGFYAHVLLAVTPECRHLGVLRTHWIVRDPATMGKRCAKRRALPITEKESYRWVADFQAVNDHALAHPQTSFYYIADRESDVYELLCAGKDAAAHLIIRSRSNRLLADGGQVHDVVSRSPIRGQVQVTIPRSGARTARTTTLALRALSVTLRAPRQYGNSGEPLTIYVVHATEVSAPAGSTPISWTLFTFAPIDTAEQIFGIVQRYVCRWQIEVYFRVLKDGCRIESLRLDHIDRLQNVIALYLVISWRVMQLMTTARQQPDEPCHDLLTPQEWQLAWILTYKKPPPKKTPSNRTIVRLIAQLGGFLARKGDGEPGAKTIWHGLETLRTAIEAAEALQKLGNGAGLVGNG